jgi:ATP-dependent Clp protease protease subunit
LNRKYFSLEKTKQTATLTIYGDITSFPWMESDVSAINLSRQLEAMTDVNQIDVYINSYGGEVAEGLAIYHALKRHKAKVRTICDGFACSIASVIFMAGDERIMNESSLLMIHNAWSFVEGNAEQLRKQADDLDKITQASVMAYKAHSDLEESEIKELMDAETWILPEEAKSYGFATAIKKAEKSAASQNAWLQLFNIIKAHQEERQASEEDEVPPDDEEEQEEPSDEEAEDTPEDEPEEAEGDEAEDPEGDEAEENPEEDPDEEDAEAAQRWSGFFNALLKM